MTQTPADYGTPQRAQHGKLKPELTGRGHAVRMRAVDGCELDRLMHASLISYAEWSAGTAFARKLHAAHMTGPAISDMQRVSGKGEMSDRMAEALCAVADHIITLDSNCGEAVRRTVTNVCIGEGKAASPEAIAAMRFGLGTLALLQDKKRFDMRRLDDLLTT